MSGRFKHVDNMEAEQDAEPDLLFPWTSEVFSTLVTGGSPESIILRCASPRSDTGSRKVTAEWNCCGDDTLTTVTTG